MSWPLAVLLALSGDDLRVLRLGSEDYHERRLAGDFLAARGWEAAAALRRGLASCDPEVRRAALVLYDDALAGAVASLGPPPMLDALWYDADSAQPGYRKDHSPEFRAAYERCNPYLERAGRDGWPYRGYYLATELWLRDELEAGRTAGDLRPLLAEMRRRDAVFLGRCRGQAVPPGD